MPTQSKNIGVNLENKLKAITHSRGENDILGSCPDNCYQCKKDTDLLILFAQAKQQAVEEVLTYLWDNGHGSGNWRRLIIQAKPNHKEK